MQCHANLGIPCFYHVRNCCEVKYIQNLYKIKLSILGLIHAGKILIPNDFSCLCWISAEPYTSFLCVLIMCKMSRFHLCYVVPSLLWCNVMCPVCWRPDLGFSCTVFCSNVMCVCKVYDCHP